MSSKRAVRRRECTGKVRHASSGLAWSAMRSLQRSGRGKGHMSVYQCHFCRGWHFGHDGVQEG